MMNGYLALAWGWEASSLHYEEEAAVANRQNQRPWSDNSAQLLLQIYSPSYTHISGLN